jgi:DNA (cytosine-5)-methyltransferase 1
MKILNLYSGIGGNRKLWGNEHEITSVEYNESIANIYKDLYPNDKVIVADAHEYLQEHFKEFDFIWTSPPCPTHRSIL